MRRCATFCLQLFALVGTARHQGPGAALTLAGIFAAYLVRHLRDAVARGDRRDRQHRPVRPRLLRRRRASISIADKIKLDLSDRASRSALVAAAGLGTGGLRSGVQGGARLRRCSGLRWCRAARLRRFNLIGDYSYGLYILCFPIQQTFVMLDPAISAVGAVRVQLPRRARARRSCHGISSSIRR